MTSNLLLNLPVFGKSIGQAAEFKLWTLWNSALAKQERHNTQILLRPSAILELKLYHSPLILLFGVEGG